MAILAIWATLSVLLAVMGGGIAVWSVCLAAITAWAAWALAPAHGPSEQSRAHRVLAWSIGGLFGLVLFSLIPMPGAIVALAGEPRAGQDREVAAAIRTASDVGLTDVGTPFFRLTRNAAGTARILALLLAAASMALLASRLDSTWRRRLMAFLSIAGAAVAVVGYVGQHVIPQGDTLLWWLPIQHALPGPVACFGNRNHFAGFVAMLSVCAFAMCLQGAREKRYASLLLHGPAFCVMSAALVLAMSRGAVLAWVAGLAAVSIFGVARRPRSAVLASLLAAAVVAAVVFALAKAGMPDRYRSLAAPLQTTSAKTRLSAWRDSLRIWASYPVIGAGANAYRTVFPQHRRTTEGAFATYPENLYVQILAETGSLGAGLALVFLSAGVSIAWRRWREDSDDRATVTAGIGAGTVVLAHGVVDMPLQVPLYAVTAATLAGLLAVRAPPGSAARSHPALRLPLAVPAMILSAALLLDAGRIRIMDAPMGIEYADQREVQRALIWAPSSWHAWYYLGRHAFMARTPRSAKFGAHCLSMAGSYDPNNYRLWLELGNMRRNMGDIEGARAAYRRVRELRSWVPVPPLPEAPQ